MRYAAAARASGLVLFLMPLNTACAASVPLEQAGSLSSYQHLTPNSGLLTQAQVSVNRDGVLETVRIIPTSLSAAVAEAKLSEAQLSLIANAVDRSRCTGLGDRFQIVPSAQAADLTVHAFITLIIPTDSTAAAASKAISVGTSVATAVTVVPMPVPSLRIPIGLGGLALEAEAVDGTGSQKAAMVWARGADSLTSRPRVSPAGDAYDLAASFGDDFSKLLVSGASPFRTLPSLPSMQRCRLTARRRSQRVRLRALWSRSRRGRVGRKHDRLAAGMDRYRRASGRPTMKHLGQIDEVIPC
jgi:hypothetical protein